MFKGMISENMSPLVNLSNDLRKISNLCSNRKKGGLDLVAFQDGQNVGGRGRIRPIIKSEGDPLFIGITSANGADEKI